MSGLLTMSVRPGDQKAGRDVGADLIARQLLDDELRIGLVGVERIDHVIAIGPGVVAERDSFRSRCFRQTAPRRANAAPQHSP